MKKIVMILAALSLSVLLGSNLLWAENLNTMTDGFYNGLGEIIEKNMNAPDRCVSEVNRYYTANHATVEKIREASRKPMMEAMSRMEEEMAKYKSMSEEELKALEEQSKHRSMKMPKPSPGSARYQKAIAEFSKKYPAQGIKISLKAMELLPQMR